MSIEYEKISDTVLGITETKVVQSTKTLKELKSRKDSLEETKSTILQGMQREADRLDPMIATVDDMILNAEQLGIVEEEKGV